MPSVRYRVSLLCIATAAIVCVSEHPCARAAAPGFGSVRYICADPHAPQCGTAGRVLHVREGRGHRARPCRGRLKIPSQHRC